MATKENKRRVRELVEALEQRIHCGPAIHTAEIQSAQDFLRQNDFSPASDYFNRLAHIENRLQGRARQVCTTPTKRNYGGKAALRQMQVQSIYDHVILSICYQGDFNTKRGRIKISHRFNQAGRIDFVELKFLNSLHPPLNGELRKLLAVKDYPSIRKDWFEAEAHVLRILPQEMIFLYEDIFQSSREQVFAWLINMGHWIVADLLQDLQSSRGKFSSPPRPASSLAWQDFNYQPDREPNLGWRPTTWNQLATYAASSDGNGTAVCVEPAQRRNGFMAQMENGFDGQSPRPDRYRDQLPLDALLRDEVALPILEKVARLESAVEIENAAGVLVRYSSQSRD